MTTTLINQLHPDLRIYNPDTGGYAQFVAGKLVIEEDDPNYAVAMAEGQRNPSIAIVKSAVYCPWCGEPFAGQTAKALESKHEKDVHFEQWVQKKEGAHAEEVTALVKDRAGVACDVCQPPMIFANDDQGKALLAAHVKLVHEQGAGESPGATDEEIAELRRPGEVTPAG